MEILINQSIGSPHSGHGRPCSQAPGICPQFAHIEMISSPNMSIVNNLEVYCGILIDSRDPYILITTYYPYSGKLKRKLFQRGKENYERFNVKTGAYSDGGMYKYYSIVHSI